MLTSHFFTDLLPWQQATWQYLTKHFPKLPHAMLFAGNAGTGKQMFVYRFVAWALCQNKPPLKACGHCESCQWLKANTHPDLWIIPTIPIDEDKKNKKTTADENIISPIKIDDIRAMQPFVQQSSQQMRLVIIHHADHMTLSASNALLKTLEEPAENVLLLLISDHPSHILPTVRSRLQSFAVSQIHPNQSLEYIKRQLNNIDDQTLQQINLMSGYAPFVAIHILQSEWYQHRQSWINIWQALRCGKRFAIQASDYWQKTLNLSQFLTLSQMMLVDVGNYISQLPIRQQDIDFNKLQPLPDLFAIHTLQHTIDEIWQHRQQHIQDKLCYDKLINQMTHC